MKTKMLFSAAMMTALFAACTNEDFVVNSQKFDPANEGRVAVENVKLNFVKGGDTDTRLTFDPTIKDWSWEGDEEIGALLMDDVWGTDKNYRPYSNPEEWAQLTWLQKYQLTNEIHTDYKFTYDESEKAWKAPEAQVLEGNYFFAYPYSGYKGRRQLIHEMNSQEQVGTSEDAMAESFAANQFWVGYGQVKEGQTEGDPVTGVYMTHVLAPIRLAITNTGTQSYSIQKIQIKGAELTSAVTIDPTNAAYKGINGQGDYNLIGDTDHAWVTTNMNGKYFNYANFLDLQDDLYQPVEGVAEQDDKVYNIGTPSNWEKNNSLRAIVKPLTTGDEQYSELTFKSKEPGDLVLKPNAGSTIYATIYVTPVGDLTDGEDVNGNELTNGEADETLTMTIYTDGGVVRDINLRKVNEEIGGNNQNTAVTDKAVDMLTPGTSNYINVQIDDQSFNETDNLEINNANDLESFIKWNSSKNRTYTATLLNDVTLTADMQNELVAAKEANADNKLVVTGDHTLTIAPGVANIFNYIDVSGVDVKVEGAVNINSDYVIGLPGADKKIIVVITDADKHEGGAVYINKYDLKAELTIDNFSGVSVPEGSAAKNIKLINEKGANAIFNGEIEFAKGSENKAEAVMIIGPTGNVAGKTSGNLTNKGVIDNATYAGGKMYNIVNAEGGLVKTGSAETSVNNLNSNAEGATILLSSLEDEVVCANNQGDIKYVADGETVDASDVIAANVTKLEINGGYFHVDNAGKAATSLLNEVKLNGTTVEGGKYGTDDKWLNGWAALELATTNAKVETSGNTTMDNVRLGNDIDVDVLDGILTIKNNVVIGNQNAASEGALNLGSKVGFDVNEATVNVTSGASLKVYDINVTTGVPGATLENNGSVWTWYRLPSQLNVKGVTVEIGENNKVSD